MSRPRTPEQREAMSRGQVARWERERERQRQERIEGGRCALAFPSNPKAGAEHCWHPSETRGEYCCHCAARRLAEGMP